MSNSFDPTEHPHRRFNSLTGEWVLVSPHRTKRPWQGKQESTAQVERPRHDPKCYLCPGNARASGGSNPDYASTFVFENDFRALLNGVPVMPEAAHPLLQAQAVNGTCRVICFSPRHDLTLPEFSHGELLDVIALWRGQSEELGRDYRWVQIFENKGEIMGCSNPHPHGQIWASDQLPNEAAKEDRAQRDWLAAHGRPLLVEYAETESRLGERMVVENGDWLAVVPWWAIWPYETLLLPKRHTPRLQDLDGGQRDSLAGILKQLLTRYDNLFNVSFPYSMGWHGAPNGVEDVSHWQLHAHFYPPLLRSATVKKFLVGYEMLSESQRDLTPEQAAGRLRELSDIHYKSQGAGQS